MEEGVDER
jgi:hypothetical protein